MDADLDNPHWSAIVGEQWPEISPAQWDSLAAVARSGAGAIDVAAFEQAQRVFEQRVRASVGLEPVRAALRREGRTLEALAGAFELIASLLDECARLSKHTRNGILDIVEEARDRIAAVEDAAARRRAAATDAGDAASGSVEQAGAEAATAQQIAAVLAEAHAEVVAWTARARESAAGQIDPLVDAIVESLEQPTPHQDDSQSPREHAPPYDTRTAPGGPASAGRQPQRSEDGLPVAVPQTVGPPGVAGLGEPYPARGPVVSPPGNDVVSTASVDAVDSPIRQSAPGVSPRPGTVSPSPPQVVDIAAHRSFDVANDTPGPAPDPGASAAKTDSRQTDSTIQDRPAAAGQAIDSAGSDTTRDPAAALTPGIADGCESDVAAETIPADSQTFESGAGLLAMAAGPAGSRPSPAVAGPFTQDGNRAPLAFGAITDTTAARPAAGTLPGVSAGPLAGQRASGAQVADPHPARFGDRHPGSGRRGDDSPAVPGVNIAAEEQDSLSGRSADQVRPVLASGLAAADPVFSRGALPDPVAELARTLLTRVLSAVDDAPLAPAWAVAVLRRADGLAAVVTSTEGRGWLPPGLYLPRTLTSPWAWESARDAGWEGIDDPARVLAEFALERARVVGDRLAAIASSGPIAPYLSHALPDVSMDADVVASGDLAFASAGPGLVDRLEFSCSPRLVARVRAVAAHEVPSKLHSLAHDAHHRLAHAGLAEPATLFDAPALRERILAARRARTPIPPAWWDELRDADDLLTATGPSLRFDASRIPLGDLRSGSHSRDLEPLRSLTLHRRANELLLLSADPLGARTLREATYVHTLLAEHPLLAAGSIAPR